MEIDAKTMLTDTLMAHGACVLVCDDTACGLPHIVLLNEANEPLFQYVVSPEFFRAIQEVMPAWKDN